MFNSIGQLGNQACHFPKENEKKRKSEIGLEDELKVKKICLEAEPEVDPVIEWAGVILNFDIFSKILSYLTYHQVLKVEQVAKNYCRLTVRRWQELKRERFFNYDWSSCEKEKYPAKSCYLLSRAIYEYIKCYKNGWICGDTTYQRFEGLMVRYPSFFGAYLWLDLTRSDFFFNESKCNNYEEIFQSNIANLSSSDTSKLGGGELLLRGLYLYKHSQDLKSPEECFSQAIQKEATCAIYMVVRQTKQEQVDARLFYSLAISSAIKGDYRGLNILMKTDNNYAFKLYRHGNCNASILRVLAKKEYDPFKKVELYEKAIEAYGEENVIGNVWKEAAQSQCDLNKWEDAWNLYEKVVQYYENKSFVYPAVENTLKTYYEHAAWIQCKLNNWKTAGEWYEKAIRSYRNHGILSLTVWMGAACVQLKLNNLKEGIELMKEATKNYGLYEDLSNFDLREIKKNNTTYDYKKWDFVKEQYQIVVKEMDLDFNSAILWTYLAFLYYALGKWKEVEELCNQVLKSYSEENIPSLINGMHRHSRSMILDQYFM